MAKGRKASGGDVVRFQGGFFDRGAIMAALDEATLRSMMRVGAYTRKVARNSMKKRKGPSAAWTPPHVHKGHVKNLLYFQYDLKSASMVVGPVGLARSQTPKALEYGDDDQEPRPFMKPALEKSQDMLARHINIKGTIDDGKPV